MAIASSPSATPSQATLAATGAVAGLTHAIWLGVVLAIIGGTLITIAKIGPRVAIEPVRRPDGSYRLGITFNGRRIGRHR